MDNYIKIERKIKLLQHKLIKINNEEKRLESNIIQLETRRKELEQQKEDCKSRLKILMLLEQNKNRIDNRIINEARNDIKLIYQSNNHITCEIIQLKSAIVPKIKRIETLQLTKKQIISSLKVLYGSKYDMLNYLIKNYDNSDSVSLVEEVQLKK